MGTSFSRVWYQVGLAAAGQGTQMILVALIGHTLGCRATDPMGFKANFVTFQPRAEQIYYLRCGVEHWLDLFTP